MKARLNVHITCPGCGFPLRYDRALDPAKHVVGFVTCNNKECAEAGKRYAPPTIELEELKAEA